MKTAVGASSPWVRIPPCPPVFVDFADIFSAKRLRSHNCSPIDRALGAMPHNAAGTVLQIGQARSGRFPGWCGCSSIHTLRDKSRLEMAGNCAFPAMAASPSKRTGDGRLTESAEKRGMRANQTQVMAFRATAAQCPSHIERLPAFRQIARRVSMRCGCHQVRRCPCLRASGIASPP